MRVYLPVTLPMLADVARTGSVPVLLTAHAVTPALREWYTEGDVEELEFAAMVEAAEASLRLLAEHPTAPPRRVVVAAEVEVAVATPQDDRGPRSRVLLPGPVGLHDVVSVHVDDLEAGADVAAAAAAVGAADRGDDDAQFVVDSAEGHDLLWYDVSELDTLLGS